MRVWDISHEKEDPIVTVKVEKSEKFRFVSLAWDENGEIIFAGCSDGNIRVYHVGVKQQWFNWFWLYI